MSAFFGELGSRFLANAVHNKKRKGQADHESDRQVPVSQRLGGVSAITPTARFCFETLQNRGVSPHTMAPQGRPGVRLTERSV